MNRTLPGFVGLSALMTAIAVFAVRSGLSSWLEAIGFVSGVLAVYLAAREHVLNWPLGLITSGAYVVFFFQGNLIADAWLQVVYVILGLLGWYWWLKGKEGKELDITRANPKTWAALAAFFVAFFSLAVWYLYRVHGAAPSIDAFVTAGSLVGQYLLMRKHIENWLVWVVVNVVYVPLFMWKGWYLTASLYVIYLVLAAMGMRQWSKSSGLKLIEARATAALIALGTMVSAWMGWTSWRFERFFGDWITAVRWSDGATVNGKRLGEVEFTLLKAEVCDPLNAHIDWPQGQSIRGQHMMPTDTIEFYQDEKPVAQFTREQDRVMSDGWLVIISAPNWLRRLKTEVEK